MVKAILHMLGRLPGTASLLPGLAYLVLGVGATQLAAVGKVCVHLHRVWDWSTAGARSGWHRLLSAALRSSAFDVPLLCLFQRATLTLEADTFGLLKFCPSIAASPVRCAGACSLCCCKAAVNLSC
jgi:hypothetical protein